MMVTGILHDQAQLITPEHKNSLSVCDDVTHHQPTELVATEFQCPSSQATRAGLISIIRIASLPDWPSGGA